MTAFAEGFWAKVNKSGECWLWTGTRTTNGYGRVGCGEKKLRAHRVAWSLMNGPIPAGSFVCHHCDVPLCVNPAHLFLGNAKSNVEDMIAKSRRGDTGGSLNGRAKLTDADVEEVRDSLLRGVSQRCVAKRFGVTPGAISQISTHRTWNPNRRQP